MNLLALGLFRGIVLAVLLIALSVGTTAHASGKKVALIIGNSKYANGDILPNPPNDAELVRKSAARAGFQIIEGGADLDFASLQAKLRDFRKLADAADVALIYYAGHGIDDNGQNWLIPTDARLSDPRDLQYEAVSFTVVMDAVAGAKLRIVMLDACRNNPFADKWTSLTRAIQPGLSRVDATEGSLVIFAADAGSTILDEGGGGNSFFAKAIAARLPEAGLSIQMLGNKIYDDVRAASSGRQRPSSASRLSGMEYYLVPKPADPGSGLDSDDATFLRAQQANTPAAYLDYLTKFPKGKSQQIAATLYSALSRAAPPVAQRTDPVTETVPLPVRVERPPPMAVSLPPSQLPGAALPPQAEPAPPKVEALPPRVEPVITAPPTAVSAAIAVPPVATPIVAAPPITAPVASAITQTAIYAAPALARAFGVGGLPLMPEAPAFSVGPYPTCKERWTSVTDPIGRVQATIDCKNAYSEYRVNWLNRYREAMNAYARTIGDIYTNEVALQRYADRYTEVQDFYNEMFRRVQGVKDGGFLMADYEQALARFQTDLAAVSDSYNRSAGCGGYPTPAGLASIPC